MGREQVAFVLLSVLALGSHCLPQPPKGDPIPAVQGLIERLLGKDYVAKFLYEVIPSDVDGHDVFEVETLDGRPMLRGNSGVALASALNHYLKYWCHCSVTWGRNGTGDQLKMPLDLPLPTWKTKTSPVKYRCVCL